MQTYLLYADHNGADLYEFDPNEESPSEVYERLLNEFDDNYYETHAYVLEVSKDKMFTHEVFIPELEE